MLQLIKIRNLALVKELEWSLGNGLIGVTGETGAGKSVIVGALKLILGQRADKSLIRTGETSCTAEAVFEMGNTMRVDAILEESGIDPCEDGRLIIRRVIAQNSNKQFVNGCSAMLGLLRELGEELVDLHGPHDHQSLLSNDRQLQMLDAYAGNDKPVANYHQLWSEWREKAIRLEDLKKNDRESRQELDLLKFQIAEIETAELKEGEDEEIEKLYQRASNSSKLAEHSQKIAQLLEGAVGEGLREIQRSAAELARLDEGVADRLAGLEQAVVELSEIEREMADYSEDLEMDPREEERLAQRINVFETLKRKYGSTLGAVIKHCEHASQRVFDIENRDLLLEELEAEVETLEQTMREAGRKVSQQRKNAAPKLAKIIATHLQELGFKQAKFDCVFMPNEVPTGSGLEGVDFLFGPNPGEPLKPLKQIASSGEVSRVMLAVKSALADQDATPLMVFDEIDANVGGSIARAVGEKMAALGEKHQVVAITHFPQVAAVADEHYVVEKTVEKGRTNSNLSKVEGQERITELVRMLGGGGDQAEAMAESLLAK